MKRRILTVFVLSLCLGFVISKPQESSDDVPAEVMDNTDPEPVTNLDELPWEDDEDYEDTDDEFEDYYTWQDRIMNPVRSVGQSISDTVGGAANQINDGVNAAADWWNGEDDYDYDDYADDSEQVNAWWDKMESAEYNYDDIDDDEPSESAAAAVEKVVSDSSEDEELDDIMDDYEDEDYDYYDLYNTIKYPKPDASKLEASQIHHPKNDKVMLPRMRSRQKQPYSVDDYFDFVVIAMCVVLLFIMLLAGVSRYNNQQYLKKAYGRNSEKAPLMGR